MLNRSTYSVYTALLSAFLLLPSAWAAEKVYVFYPTSTRAQIVQRELSSACGSSMDISVFARYTDLVSVIGTAPPAAILCRPELLEQFPDYQIALRGSIDGRSADTCLLLSADQPVDTSNLSAITIGAVDYMGRLGTEAFVNRAFSKSVKVKRVTKVEDLLSLISLRMADAVLVTRADLVYIKSGSQLKFITLPIAKASLGGTVLAIRRDNSQTPALVKKVRSLPVGVSAMIGVDIWR